MKRYKIKKERVWSSCTALVLMAIIAPVSAQEILQPQNADAPVTASAPGQSQADVAAPSASVLLNDNNINLNDLNSLIFNYWEHTSIEDAKRLRGVVRTPTDEELLEDMATKGNLAPPLPEDREIKLGGIVYVDNKDWTIWLNGKRITPQALPKEAIDLKVYREFIEIEWFDNYTNQVFPLRLRTHQRFNLDTRIFLPG